MKAMIKKELRLSGRLLLVWMGMVLILCGFAYFEYLSLRGSLEELTELLDSFPKILAVMFGVSEGVHSALGWYGCIYFWVTLLTNSYAAYLGVSCIAKERAQGTMEYLFTKPVSRGRIVDAKVVASGCCMLLLAAFSGLCCYFTAVRPLGGLGQGYAVIATTIGMFLTETVLFAAALLLSALPKTYRGAVKLGAGMLIFFYAADIAAGYTGIPVLDYITPLKYFDVYRVARNGFERPFLLAAAAAVAASVAGARKIWSQKEIGA